VTSSELAAVLADFTRDKLAQRERHIAGAQRITNYDFNNTYQYIIAREEMHVSWLADAIADMGGTLETVPEPSMTPAGKGDAAQASVIGQDRDGAAEFLSKWRPRMEKITHARHRNMLKVILGETLEHKRFFEQALAGRSDLLGRRADGAGTPGSVMPTRWVE
jgi:hypothetical protein